MKVIQVRRHACRSVNRYAWTDLTPRSSASACLPQCIEDKLVLALLKAKCQNRVTRLNR